jgi:hypothetical protein
MNCQIDDVSNYFDKLYKQCSIEVEKEQNSKKKKMKKHIGFVIVQGVLFLGILLLILKFVPSSWADLAISFLFLLLAIRILLSVYFDDIITEIPISRLMELKAERILSKHLSQYNETKELMRGLEISMHIRQAVFKSISTMIGGLILFVSLAASTLNDKHKIMDELFNYLSVPKGWHYALFTVIYCVLAVVYFLTIYAPIERRNQLKMFLERQIAINS